MTVDNINLKNNTQAQINNDISVSRSWIESILNAAKYRVFYLWETPLSTVDNPKAKSMIVSFELESGFTIDARCVVSNPEHFDKNIGFTICYEDAVTQLWAHEAYLAAWLKHYNHPNLKNK